MAERNAVPLFVVTGFLGSGKTTLVNELLSAQPRDEFKNLAVIVNEFGDVGIDGDLVNGAEQVDIPGGCVCCLQNQALEEVLVGILEREPAVDCILLETTGIAEPLPIGWVLEEETLAGRISLRVLLCVVDPLGLEKMREQSPACESQIEHAGIICLSHQDEPDGIEAKHDCLRELRTLNREAIIVASAPPARADTLWQHVAGPTVAGTSVQRANVDYGHEHVQSVSVAAEKSYDMQDLTEALATLSQDVWRVKGLVDGVDHTLAAPRRGTFAVHMVGGRASWEYRPQLSPGTIVAIGKSVDEDALVGCLREAEVA